MREILYRAISMCRGEHWVYGQPRHYARNPHTEKWTIYDPVTGIETDIVEETLGQYTGLTDKNGNKIFEGDIVEYQYVICEEDGVGVYENPVTFENGCFCIDGDSDFTLSYAIWSSDEYGGLTIIGNIHDNPELMKGGEK